MILRNSAAAAEATRRRYVTGDGMESSVVRYFGMTASANPAEPPQLGALYPVAFRVEQDPGSRSEPHFHQANQFQVFIEGDGFLGKTPVRPVTVQYADAYSPYGPIDAGPTGVAYLTLRNGWDPGALYMPGARDQLKAFGRRPRTIVRATDAQLQQTGTDVLMDPQTDGPGAWHHRIAPGARFIGPDPAAGGGQYWVCLAGNETACVEPLQRFSCLFLSPDEKARTAIAGPDGLDVLVLQFPQKDFAESARTG
jgi:hypothetical protein